VYCYTALAALALHFTLPVTVTSLRRLIRFLFQLLGMRFDEAEIVVQC